MTARLLIRPQFDVGDGANGYLLKLASFNGCTVQDLYRIGIRPTSLQDKGLCSRSGRDALVKVLSQPWRLAMAKAYDYRRYCPICLREDRLAGIECEMAYCNACPRHGVRLRVACQACDQPLTWKNGSSTHCPCGSDLRRHATTAASTEEVSVAGVLVLAATNDTSSMGVFKNLSLTHWFILLHFLGMVSARSFKSKTGSTSLYTTDPAANADLWSEAASAVRDWPNTFLDRVAELQTGPDAAPSNRITQVFGALYHAMYSSLADEVFAAVRTEFETYIGSHWWSGLSTRNSRLRPALEAEGQPSQWLSVAEICRQLKLGHRAVQTLIDSGALVARKDSIGDRQFLYISRESALRYTAARDDAVSAFDAAEILCISQDRACEIAFACGFHDPSQLVLPGYPSRPFSRSFLRNLLDVMDSLPVLDVLEPGQVTFDTLLRGSRLSAPEVGTLMRQILNHEIVVAGRYQTYRSKLKEKFRQPSNSGARAAHGGLSGLVFDRSQIDAIKQKRTIGKEMNIQEAAKQLALKEEVVYHLVGKGLLVSKRSVERFPRNLIEQSTLDGFRRDYVLAKTDAQALKISSTALRRHLVRAGVEPVCAADIDGCRAVIFRNDAAYRSALNTFRQQSG